MDNGEGFTWCFKIFSYFIKILEREKKKKRRKKNTKDKWEN